MIMNFMRKEKGYISIFLCLILLPMVTYATMIVDASRIQMSRVQLQSAGDLAMNAALSEYEQALEEMYGLFATAESEADLKPAVQRYFQETIESAITVNQENGQYTKQLAKEMTDLIFANGEVNEDDITNFIEMKLSEQDFEYHGIPESRVSNPMIMKSQIIDYMKYKGPVSLATNLMTKIGFLHDSDKQIEAIEKKIEYTEAVSELGDYFDQAWTAIQNYNDARDAYENAGYSDKKTVYEAAVENTPVYEKMAKTALFHNSFQKSLEDTWNAPGNIMTLDGLTDVRTPLADIYGMDVVPLTEMSTDTLEDAIAALEQIETRISDDIINIRCLIDESYITPGIYETLYDRAVFVQDTENEEKVSKIFIYDAEGVNDTADNRAYNSKVRIWNQEFSSCIDGENPENSNLSQLYEYQLEHFQHYHELREREAYFVYFRDLYNLYNSIYDKYSSELAEIKDSADKKAEETESTETETTESAEEEEIETASETEDAIETESETESEALPVYTDEQIASAKNRILMHDALKQLKSAWENSENYRDYKKFMNTLVSETPYKKAGEAWEKKLTSSLKNFYASAVNVRDKIGGSGGEPSASSLTRKITALRTQVDAVDKKGDKWEEYIDRVNDETTKTEMLSDQKSTTEFIQEEDAQNLFDIVNKIWCDGEPKKQPPAGLKGLVVDIESIKFMGKSVYNRNVSYQTFKGMDDLKAVEGDGAAITAKYNEVVKHDYGSFIDETNIDIPNSKYDGVTNNLKYLRKIDGKTDPDAISEAKDEVFYYVLESNAKAKESQKQQLSLEDQNAFNKMNEANNDEKKNHTETAEENNTNENQSGDNSSSQTQQNKEENKTAKGSASEVGNAYNTIIAQNGVAKDTNKNYGSVDPDTGNVPSGDDEKNYKKSTESGKNSLEVAKKLLQDIKKLGQNLGEDVYLEEYFTEMFTCQTDAIEKNKDKVDLLNGYTSKAGSEKMLNTDNEWYGKEIEYILWGNSDLKKNLSQTETYIYLIRFALNAIYAFQAADITGFASAVATATVGWSVVLVPIVKVVIILGVALTESAYDLMLLKNGESVVILKNGTTFVCSPRGALAKVAGKVTDYVIEKTADYVESKIDDAIDNLEIAAGEVTDDTINKCNGVINDYADSLTEQIKTSIRDTFTTPFMNAIEPMVNRLNDDASNAESLVKEAVDKAWLSIDASINEEDAAGEIIRTLYNSYGNKLKSEITSKLGTLFAKGKSQISMTAIENAIQAPVNNWLESHKGEIEEKTKTTADNIKKEMKKYYKDSAEGLKSHLHEEISKQSANFSNVTREKLEYGIAKNVTGTDAPNKTGSSGVTLNYKEFCKIFMFMKLASDVTDMENSPAETACLQRSAALIQANIRYAKENADTSFNITEAYTIVNINATVKMGTLFPWTASVGTTDTDDASISADFSHLGQNFVNISYSGICGY